MLHSYFDNFSSLPDAKFNTSVIKNLYINIYVYIYIYVGNPSKTFLLLQGKELAAAQFKLIELTATESVQKLFDLETELISKFSFYTVQEDWLLKTKTHLEKYEKKLRLKKLKKIRMLASTDDLRFACLERFESHYQFFHLKSSSLEFCESFFPDFENLHYLLHLNESEDDVSEEKDLENDSSVEIRDVNTSSLDNGLNIEDNAAKMLNNTLQGNFISKNVVNLSRQNLTDSEISLLPKGLNFVPTSNTIDKAKLKTEIEALGRVLRLKWQFRNEESEFIWIDLSQNLLSIRAIKMQPLKYT